MTRKKRLGRGLESLLNSVEVIGESPVSVIDQPQHEVTVSPTESPINEADPLQVTPVVTSATAATMAPPSSTQLKDGEVVNLSVYEIEDNPFQPRREFGESELASLAESLKEHNILQPILVRVVDGRYQLISGERRLRAAIKANWQTIPARIRNADDRLVSELAIVENLQRKDLNAIEKALSFRRYLNEHECTQEGLASRLKIDRSTIANLMRLLELPPEVQSAVTDAKISAGHARALLPLGDEDLQVKFSQRIVNEGISVRGAEKMVADHISAGDLGGDHVTAPTNKSVRGNRSSQVTSLETELRMALGTKVQIKQGTREKGQIVVHYANSAEFERLKGMMAGK